MFTVIMAGGSGTRFWPMSRRSKPKQFLNISGKAPLMVETCDRMKGFSRDEEIILVLGENHLREAESLLKGRRVHFVAEPLGRNTAPCIGLGAVFASHLGCAGPSLSFRQTILFATPPPCLKSSSCRRDRGNGRHCDSRHCSHESGDRLRVYPVDR